MQGPCLAVGRYLYFFSTCSFPPQVVCPECFLVWCFPCQAPWHENVSCKEYRTGDKLLRKWAQSHVHGQANAQKCPKCKVFSSIFFFYKSADPLIYSRFQPLNPSFYLRRYITRYIRSIGGLARRGFDWRDIDILQFLGQKNTNTHVLPVWKSLPQACVWWRLILLLLKNSERCIYPSFTLSYMIWWMDIFSVNANSMFITFNNDSLYFWHWLIITIRKIKRTCTI